MFLIYFQRWLNEGVREEDFQIELIQNLIYFPKVTMADDFRTSLQKAPQKYRYNIVQMFLKGHKSSTENLTALMKNQNDVEKAIFMKNQSDAEKAIKAKQNSELEKITADLKTRLEKFGAQTIKTV